MTQGPNAAILSLRSLPSLRTLRETSARTSLEGTFMQLPQYSDLMARLGLQPDPWQAEVLDVQHRRLLLNCCRSAGKTTVIAVLSLFEALTKFGTLVLILSRSHRQSRMLYRELRFYYK